MEREYRLKQEELLGNHILNQEILVHCIARLNTKINKAYNKCKIIKAAHQNNIKSGNDSLALRDKQDYEEWKDTFDCLMEKKRPLLNALIQGYRLSLEDAKELVRQADKEKFPTYKTVDIVVQMIRSCGFKLEWALMDLPKGLPLLPQTAIKVSISNMFIVGSRLCDRPTKM